MTGREMLKKLEPMPDDAQVPVRWIREHLTIEAGEMEVAAPAETDELIDELTVAEVARKMTRSASTIRSWCPDIPGAYKLHGKDWRIPRAGLRAYLDRQAGAGAPSGSSVESYSAEDPDHDWDLED